MRCLRGEERGGLRRAVNNKGGRSFQEGKLSPFQHFFLAPERRTIKWLSPPKKHYRSPPSGHSQKRIQSAAKRRRKRFQLDSDRVENPETPDLRSHHLRNFLEPPLADSFLLNLLNSKAVHSVRACFGPLLLDLILNEPFGCQINPGSKKGVRKEKQRLLLSSPLSARGAIFPKGEGREQRQLN